MRIETEVLARRIGGEKASDIHSVVGGSFGRMEGRRAAVAVAVLALLWVGACSRVTPGPQTLRIAYQHELVTLDPFGHDDAVTRSVLGAVYEPLVRVGDMLEVEPCLAKRWETRDDLTWRFTLRSGVFFHDGSPMRVEDVVRSVEHAAGAPGSRVATYLTSIENVASIPDEPGVVEIRTRYPAPLLLTRLALVPIVPQAALEDPSHPMGTGPYRWLAGSLKGPVRLRVWERYWGPAPVARDVVAELIPSESMTLERVLSGRVDIVAEISENLLPPGGLGAEWKIVRFPPLATTFLGCNVLHPPLDDPRVRTAIDLAIDRKELARVAASRRVQPALGLVPQSVVGSMPVEEPARSDPEMARDLIEEAGYAGGVTLRLEHAGVWPPVVDFIRSALADVGMTVKPELESYERFYKRVLGQQCELYLFGWSFPFGDASDLLDALVHSRDPVRRLGLQNGSGYSDTEVDRWIEAAGREPRSTLRQDLIRRALARVERDRPYIPLYHRVRLALVRNGYELKPFGTGWLSPQCIVRVSPEDQ